MYENHWQLERPPFRDDADDAFLFTSETHESSLLKMLYVVENGLGAALVVGEPGVGKTHLARLVPERLPETHGPVVHLDFPQLTPAEFLGQLAYGLSARAPFDDRNVSVPTGTDATLRRVHTLPDGSAAEGRHPAVVVDELHHLDEQVLTTLHLLLNHQPNGRLDFSLVLVGLPIVLPRIERLPQLHDRLATKSLVRRLDADETAEYVRHRLAVAGTTDDVFDASAMRSLFECSRGVPRRINRLADMALLVGYADRVEVIDAAVVDGVAEELTAVRAA